MAKRYKNKKSKHNGLRESMCTTFPSNPMSIEDKEGWSGKWYLLFALIMVITLVSYGNSLNNEFVFDDNPLIRDYTWVRGIEKTPLLLGMGKWDISYRPVRRISYALDYTLNKKLWGSTGGFTGDDTGFNPLGYHISNCIYHLLTSFLVFLVVARLGAGNRIAFLAAALFAIHPVHTDSVTYLSGRRDILVTLFYLLGFYFFLRYRQTRKTLFILAALFSYLLSLGSKEMGITLPAIFLCYDLVNNFPDKARIADSTYGKDFLSTFKKVLVQSKYLYTIIFSGALLFASYKVFIKSPSFRTSYYGDSMMTTFLTVGKILVHYMRLLVYPINLNADYSYNAFPLSQSFLEPATLVSFMVLLIIGYATLRLIVTHKIVAFGIIWFFITLLPVCHIVPHHELLAEHYLYLPSFGFCLVTAYLISRLLRMERYRYYSYGACAAAVILFSLRIADRNRDWKDDLTLWQKTVKTAPRCARAHSNLGLAYYDRALFDEAIPPFKEALAIDPKVAQVHFNLGLTYDAKGMIREAITQYETSIALLPRFAKAYNNLAWIYATAQLQDIRNGSRAIMLATRACELTGFKNPKYLDTLATVYAEQGESARAMDYQLRALQKAHLPEKGWYLERLRQYPSASIAFDNFKILSAQDTNAGAGNDLGFLYREPGAGDQVIAAFERAVKENPDSAENHYNLGVAYLRRGSLIEATSHFLAAQSNNHERAAICMGMGMVSAYSGGFDTAITFFKRALDIKPDLAEAHHNLASTYYLKGDYKTALYHCDQAELLGHMVSPQLLELLAPYH